MPSLLEQISACVFCAWTKVCIKYLSRAASLNYTIKKIRGLLNLNFMTFKNFLFCDCVNFWIILIATL